MISSIEPLREVPSGDHSALEEMHAHTVTGAMQT